MLVTIHAKVLPWKGWPIDLYPEYDKLQKIYAGEDKNPWQHSNYNRRFYKSFLKNGKAIRIVTYTLFYDVVFLSVITFLDHSPFLKILDTIVWYFGYGTLNISIIIPLLFIWFSGRCYSYLFGNHENKGRVRELEISILKRYRVWGQEQKEKVLEFKAVSPVAAQTPPS